MSKDTPGVSLDDFPFRCEVRHSSKVPWDDAACEAFVSQLDLPPTVRSLSLTRSYGSPGRSMTVGLRFVELKKLSGKAHLVVSYAGFNAKGEVVAWSADLDPDPGVRDESTIMLRDESTSKAFRVDNALRARVLKLAGGGRDARPAPPSIAVFAHSGRVLGVAVAPDGRHIASTGYDKKLILWDLQTGLASASVAAAGTGLASLHAVAVAPDGSAVATGPRKLTVWGLPGGEKRLQIDAHTRNGEIQGLCYSPSGRLIASTSHVTVVEGDRSAAVWDAATGAQVARWKLDGAGGRRVCFAPDERTLFVLGTMRDSLFAFNLDRPEPARVRRFASDYTAESLAVAPTGAVFVGVAGRILELDPESLETRRELAVRPEGLDGPSGLFALSPDGALFAVPAQGGLDIVDPSGNVLRHLDTGSDGIVRCLAWSPAGDLIVAGAGSAVRRWDAPTGEPR